MSIAEKFEIIADAVYEKGVEKEYDRFWDSYQNYGKSTSYINSFAGTNWNDEVFKPKYPIVTNIAPNRTNSMFVYSPITQIMVPLYFYDTTSVSTFANCPKLVKIGDDTGGGIWVTRNRTFTSNFSGCSKLEEIRFIDYNEKGEFVPSEIGSSIDFKDCPLLSAQSQINIIKHLVNYGSDNTDRPTLTIRATAWETLNVECAPSDVGIDFDGSWVSYVSSLGWDVIS